MMSESLWDADNSEHGIMTKRLALGTYSLGVGNGSLGYKLSLLRCKLLLIVCINVKYD